MNRDSVYSRKIVGGCLCRGGPCARPRWGETLRGVLKQSAGVSPIVVSLILMVIVSIAHAEESAYLLPSDSQKGMEVFFDKGCIRCHSVLGEGGKTAPDIGRTPGVYLSAKQLAGVMWNHAPRMWEKMKKEEVDIPRLSREEVTDLFAFLYSVRYFDEPGDPPVGKQLLTSKRCIHCHAIQGEGGSVGPDLSGWAQYVNPILWAQMMWNHAPYMEQAMEEEGFAWPEFKGSDMVDLLSYIRSASPLPKSPVYLLPADPKAGEDLFSSKGCINCHAIHGKGGGIGPDLGERGVRLPRTLTQFAGLMWNHSPQMWRKMKEKGMKRSLFSDKEMADLIVYLYSLRFFDESGDEAAGKRAFSDKKCILCHSMEGEPPHGLSGWRGRISPIMMAYIMWNHGPMMLRKMEEMDAQWPVFKGREMVDLIEYLDTGGK